MAQFVLLNLYPANVTSSTRGPYRQVRAVVFDDGGVRKLHLYGLEGGGVALVHETALSAFDRPTRRRRGLDPDYTATTALGEVWEIRKAGGCGCGSKLKSFNPFRGANRVGT